MKRIFFSLSAVIFTSLFFSVSVGTSSCEKEPVLIHDTTSITVRDTIIEEVCPPSIHGLWIGTYTADLLPNDPARYYSFVIKPGGALVVEAHPLGNTPYFATGTWTLSGTTLTCNIVYPTAPQGYSVSQTSTATYDNINHKLTSGVWVNNGPPGGTGKFVMNKIL